MGIVENAFPVAARAKYTGREHGELTPATMIRKLGVSRNHLKYH